MASDIYLIKTGSNTLGPADQASAVVITGIKLGKTVKAKITNPRNYRFLQKYMVLIGFGFEYFEPPESHWKGMAAEKDIEIYRSDVQILAGHYVPKYHIDGSVTLISKSISFANMDDTEFNKVYKSVFSVIWKHTISKMEGWTEADMQRVISQLEGFT